MGLRSSPRVQFILALAVSSVVSLGLFVYNVWRAHSLIDDYLPLNLLLAWIPLALSIRLVLVLRHKLWSSWEALALTVLWIIFLPNSFYMISDFIHLQAANSSAVLYDAVMFSCFIFTALFIGFASLFPIHLELRRRISSRASTAVIGLTLLLVSGAIYFGRDLRWNSWNVFTNPGGLLFDLSDRLLHATSYPHMILTVTTFFVFLITTYHLIWRSVRLFVRGAPS